MTTTPEPNKHATDAAKWIDDYSGDYLLGKTTEYKVAVTAKVIQEACEATAAEAVREALKLQMPHKHSWFADKSGPGYICECGALDIDVKPSPYYAEQIDKAEQGLALMTVSDQVNRDARIAQEQRAFTAEQLVLEMREALEKRDAVHPSEYWAELRRKALSLSAPIAGKWVSVEVLKDALPIIERIGTTDADSMDNLRRAQKFLAKHGDKLDNIEARRPPAFVDDGRIRPQRD